LFCQNYMDAKLICQTVGVALIPPLLTYFLPRSTASDLCVCGRTNKYYIFQKPTCACAVRTCNVTKKRDAIVRCVTNGGRVSGNFWCGAAGDRCARVLVLCTRSSIDPNPNASGRMMKHPCDRCA
jgi:hypothetical protein